MRVTLLACALLATSCGSLPEIPKPEAFFGPKRTPANIAAFFDCLREKSLTIVSAHRGGDLPAEDSIPTFERTVRGAPGPVILEVDVRAARDRTMVLLHDETLDRTTSGKGPVAKIDGKAFTRLKLKDASGSFLKDGPPTLDRALDWAEDRAILMLDVRDPALLPAAVAAVRTAKASQRVIFAMHDVASAVTMQRNAPDLMIVAPAAAVSDLDPLRADLSHVLAWTGTKEPDAALNTALAREGVETIFGTLGGGEQNWDGQFAKDQDKGYAIVAAAGVRVIATDRPLEAMRVLDDSDGPGAPAANCLQARPAS